MADSKPAQRQRLKRGERREQIIEAATAHFAEHGFDASTRQIAEAAGITQPLLYSHFPSKDALIRAVYERVYLDRWKPAWDSVLADRSQPLRARLIAFYADYCETIFDPVWARLYLQAGLKSLEINRWYMALVEERVIRRIVREIRAAHGLPDEACRAITEAEAELVWTFHGGLFYHGVRREIFAVPRQVAVRTVIAGSVDMLLLGAASAMKDLDQ
ncbi:MAG: TetR/AcrR family transcriptional regulator [Pseudomonadota bacterium]